MTLIMRDDTATPTDPRPCRGKNSNICVGEGCYAEACLETRGPRYLNPPSRHPLFSTCTACWAMVDRDHQKAHSDWHGDA